MKQREQSHLESGTGDGQTRSSNGTAGKRGTGRRNEVAMGIAIVVVVLFVFFGIRYLEDRPLFSGTYELVAEFDQADGLLRGSAVKISGVQVGEVSDVRLQPQGHRVDVRMRISDDVRIPEGSVASIQGLAALDNVSVAIEPGPEGAPALEDGAALPGSRQTSLVDRVDTTLAGAQQTFEGAESLIAETERDLGVILTNMQSASGDVAVLLRNERGRLHQTLVDLESTAAQLDVFAARLDRAATEGGDSLSVAVGELNDVMRRLQVVVGSLERGSADLESVLAHIESGEGSFGRFVYDASLYTRLDSAAVRLDAILAEFQKNPGKYLEKLELVDIF